MKVIKDGDLVLLFHDRRKNWVKRVVKGQKFHSHLGFIDYDEIIGKPFGDSIRTTPKEKLVWLFEPTAADLIISMKRASQIIYPEDIGLILVHSNLKPGSQVVEAGCGSGSLTSILARFVGPTGHIYSYDVREGALAQAKKNLERMGVLQNCTLEVKDIITEVEHENIDFVMLDMGTASEAIPKVREFLRPSGMICVFSPVLEQLAKNAAALRENFFREIHSYELILREVQTRENATRPRSRMVGHTGYLTFARKVIPFEKEPKEEEKANQPIEKVAPIPFMEEQENLEEEESEQ